ncbi:hypothetical protein LTR37_011350 [Vermiconidia calcicola]|uniref:Uncharacterized protein n=1 Tax=Vermiconidia calcicola TaxID=1690605 RepID=A0ACC3N256_9PEZI|nr:hypothetical protein LTR37_011350 [Vermiconidia calcicola]
MSIVKTGRLDGFSVRPKDAGRSQAKIRTAPPSSKAVYPASRSPELPRAASYTYMNDAKAQKYFNASSVKEESSESDTSGRENDTSDITPPDSSGVDTPEENVQELELRAPRARAIAAELRKNPHVRAHELPDAVEDGTSSVASSPKDDTASLGSSSTASTGVSTAPTTPKPRSSMASNFSRKLTRRSWVQTSSTPATPSRSPSPPKQERPTNAHNGGEEGDNNAPVMTRKKSFSRRIDSLAPSGKKKADKASQSTSDEQEPPVGRKLTVLKRKKTTRPLSGLFKGSTTDENEAPTIGKSLRASSSETLLKKTAAEHEEKRPAVPALPKSFSTDRLPSSQSGRLSPNSQVPMPRLLSTSQRTTTSGLTMPRKKDELWSAFRALDGDFAKFSSKSLAFKANVVRSSLLPFLRTYATHPSNRTLRIEDLDRRTNILNKWWTGLVEMLHGRNNQSISGTDRPAILDGVSGIMERPEWRLSPSPFCPLDQRMKGTSTPRNRSKISIASDQSDFLAESVHHNVRNTFIQNLSAQMAFVVDKMSLRNASASLVTFCGKACAYAFMFVPGMADVLVRLWDLQMDTLRRVLDGSGIGKFDNLTDTANGVVSGFPPALQQLGFSSLMKYMRKLRTPPPLPVGTANIQWWGHWLDRWSGRESDLFYVFVKYYHILATDFLPPDASKQELMCAPGLLLVQAQILTNLDATIHRSAKQAQQDSAASEASPTFDDVLADPDAVASTLPVLPTTTNAVRSMAENRLIMLIRDFLSERAALHPIARQIFAESFNNLLQTVARGTSMFDHAACYTLLDFLEEALPLLVRCEDIARSKGSLIDFDFWTMVWRKMIGSQNTMTEIRLYAFLYTVWNSVICDLGWKAQLCTDLLLDNEIFESRFNHWCPMVRAYFMRLLCWRVGRYDGESTSGDITTLETLLERLQMSWSYYLHLRDKAVQQDALAPATNPCNPAPSRRLLIIRTDPQVSPSPAFLSFDGFVAPKSPSDNMKRNSTISHVIEIDARPGSSMSFGSDFGPEEPRGRGGIGGFLKNLIPSSKTRSKSQGPARAKTDSPQTTEKPNGLVRSATDDLQGPRQPTATVDKQPALPSQLRSFSFKFSLEYYPNAKPLPPMRLFPPRLPLPAQQYLQTFSQKANAAPSSLRPIQPTGESVAHARYCGRALAEWTIVLGECQSFFERRKNEGMGSNKAVETPALGVEVFRRPG